MNNQNLTKTEAIEAARSGKKVAHVYYEPDEHFTFNEKTGLFVFEDGLTFDLRKFNDIYAGPRWDAGWRIVE